MSAISPPTHRKPKSERIEKLAGFLDRSRLGNARRPSRFQLHLTGTHVLPATINVTVSRAAVLLHR